MTSGGPAPATPPRTPAGGGESGRTPLGAPRPTGGAPGARPLGPEDAEDAAIVGRVVAGDRDAFELLVERHRDRVFRLALRLCGGDRGRAEDVAQEAFLRAFRGLAGFEHGALFGTWLHRVTVNVAISEIRRRRASKRGAALSLDAPAGPEDERTLQVESPNVDPASDALADERRRHVLSAIDALEPELKVLVVLVNLEGRSYEEAAEIASVPIGTVRSRLHRAREILEERLRRTLRIP